MEGHQRRFAARGLKPNATLPMFRPMVRSTTTGMPRMSKPPHGVIKCQRRSVPQTTATSFLVITRKINVISYAVKVFMSNFFQWLVSGPEECHDKTIPSTMVKPEEMCDLQPATDCQIVTNLVPHLIRHPICEDVPKEFCHMKLDSPKLVTKPVTMKWRTFPNGEQPDSFHLN